MARRSIRQLFAVMPLAIIFSQGAVAQDQYNNNTPGGLGPDDFTYHKNCENYPRAAEQNGWECVGDPSAAPDPNRTRVWCHMAPPGADDPLVCLKPGENPAYLQGRADRGSSSGNGQKRAKPGPGDPVPYDPYSQGPQYVSPNTPPPKRLNGGTGYRQPTPNTPTFTPGVPSNGNRPNIDLATSSIALIGGATKDSCGLRAQRDFGYTARLRTGPEALSETIFICLGVNHSDGEFISGRIVSADGGARHFRSIGGRFKSLYGGRQPSYEITSLNGEDLSQPVILTLR